MKKRFAKLIVAVALVMVVWLVCMCCAEAELYIYGDPFTMYHAEKSRYSSWNTHLFNVAIDESLGSGTWTYTCDEGGENAPELNLQTDSYSCSVSVGEPYTLVPGTYKYTLTCETGGSTPETGSFTLNVKELPADISFNFEDIRPVYTLENAASSVDIPRPKIYDGADAVEFTNYITTDITIDNMYSYHPAIVSDCYQILASDAEAAGMALDNSYLVIVSLNYYNVSNTKSVLIKYGTTSGLSFDWGLNKTDEATINMYSSKPAGSTCSISATNYQLTYLSRYPSSNNMTYSVNEATGSTANVATMDVSQTSYGSNLIMKSINNNGTSIYDVNILLNNAIVGTKKLTVIMQSGDALPQNMTLTETVFKLASDDISIEIPISNAVFTGGTLPPDVKYSLGYYGTTGMYTYFDTKATATGLTLTRNPGVTIPDGAYRCQFCCSAGNINYSSDFMLIVGDDVSEIVRSPNQDVYYQFSADATSYQARNPQVCQCTLLVDANSYKWEVISSTPEGAPAFEGLSEGRTCTFKTGSPDKMTPNTYTYTIRCTADGKAYYTDLVLKIDKWEYSGYMIDYNGCLPRYTIDDGKTSVLVPRPVLRLNGNAVSTNEYYRYMTVPANGCQTDGDFYIVTNEGMTKGNAYVTYSDVNFRNLVMRKPVIIGYGISDGPVHVEFSLHNSAGARDSTTMTLYDPITVAQGANYTIDSTHSICGMYINSPAFNPTDYDVVSTFTYTGGDTDTDVAVFTDNANNLFQNDGAFNYQLWVREIKGTAGQSGKYTFELNVCAKGTTTPALFTAKEDFTVEIKDASVLSSSVSFDKTTYKANKESVRVPYPKNADTEAVLSNAYATPTSASYNEPIIFMSSNDYFYQFKMNDEVEKGRYILGLNVRIGNVMYPPIEMKLFYGIGDIADKTLTDDEDDITTKDAEVALEGIIGKVELEQGQQDQADVNGDGKVDNKDMVALLQLLE